MEILIGFVLVCCGIETATLVAELFTGVAGNMIGGAIAAMIIVIPMYLWSEYKYDQEFKQQQEVDRRRKEQSARLRAEALAQIDNIAPEGSIFIYSEEMIQELLTKVEITRYEYAMMLEYVQTKGYQSVFEYRLEQINQQFN